MKKIALAATAVVCLGMTGLAHADPITYSLTLDSVISTSNDGTGSLTINTAPSTTGTTTYKESSSTDTLEALSFTVDGHTFNLSDVNDTPSVEFTKGTLNQITYSGTDVLGFWAELTFDTNCDLSYIVSFDGIPVDGGTISATEDASAPTSVTPEPSSLALLGTGITGVFGLMRRRRLA